MAAYDLPEQIPAVDPMAQLTREQQAVAACNLAPGRVLKVMAFAGTGKTTTLMAFAEARPHLRFLYLAFNKSVQLEAARRFPSNVTAKTAHALAFRTHGARHRDRLVAGFRANTVMDALGLDRYEDARFAMDTLCRYLVSADPKVTVRHVPFQAKEFYGHQRSPLPDLIGLANRLGRLMCDGSDQRIGMLHDGYLNLYQLSGPRLPFDTILMDEAQDISPVISSLVLAQTRAVNGSTPASVILVGDSHQQIYSFRGARNTLASIEASKTLYLTRSFRFDNNVARVANMVLETFKGEQRPLVGTPVDRSAKPPWDPKHYTVIARTNAAVFARAALLVKTRQVGFMGGVGGYRLNVIRDVFYLFAKEEKKDRRPLSPAVWLLPAAETVCRSGGGCGTARHLQSGGSVHLENPHPGRTDYGKSRGHGPRRGGVDHRTQGKGAGMGPRAAGRRLFPPGQRRRAGPSGRWGRR